MLSRMLVPMALVLFFASPLIAAVPPGEPSSASLLARPVDMRREDHAKRASPWGNEPPFNIVFDDLELTKTDQHMRIFKIHCGYWLEDGITYLAFDYKNMHDITGSEVHSVEHSREAHGYPGDGTVTHVELVRGDFIHKVVVHRSPTINGGNFRINYMEFWTANGDRQHKALYTCGVADPKGKSKMSCR